MIRLQYSNALQRMIRQDDLSELAIPTWTLVREAIQTGRIHDAFELIEYGCSESKTMHDSCISIINDCLTYIASFGEEEVNKFFRKRYFPLMSEWIKNTPGVDESLQIFTEYQRSHFGNFDVTEESDRYILRYDPCGSGGRLRRIKNVATTKKAYPWSWGKSNVPYYCTHCCVGAEIVPTELRGFPLRITLIATMVEDPCIHLLYKKPELIPEEYFTRIGMTKTIK